MRVLLAFLLCLVFAAKATPSVSDERAFKCAETREKIRRIEAKMRQGYTAREGIRMQEELRSLRDRRKRLCR